MGTMERTAQHPLMRWLPRTQQYLTERLRDEGFKVRRPTAAEARALAAKWPDPPRTEDDAAPFGFRAVTLLEARAYWDAVAAHYDRLMLLSAFAKEATAIAYLAMQIEALEPTHVVDAGCGTGLPLGFLAPTFPDVRFTAYDCSSAMLAVARRRIASLGVRNVELHVADHAHVGAVLAPNTAGLCFTKSALSTGSFSIPDFTTAPLPIAAWEEFFAMDPTMQQWLQTLAALAEIIRPDGVFIDIGEMTRRVAWMTIEICALAGLSTGEPEPDVIARNADDTTAHPDGPASQEESFVGAVILNRTPLHAVS